MAPKQGYESYVLDPPSCGVFQIFLRSSLSGDPMIASTTVHGQTLASMGFTTLGTTGTFSINGKGNTTNMNVGQPVPGPLPLLAAGSAFGLSRRLRRRFALSPTPGEG